MSELFTLLMILGFCAVSITDSLVDGRWRRFILPLLFLLLPAGAAPFLVRLPMHSILGMVESVEVLELIALAMILEGILVLWTGMGVIKGHYRGKPLPLATHLFFMPSIAALFGTVWASFRALHLFPGAPHFRTIILTALAASFLILIGGTILRLAVSHWGTRLELRMLCAMVQLVAAALLPGFLTPLALMGESAGVDIRGTLMLLGLILICALFGMILRKLLLKRELNGIC